MGRSSFASAGSVLAEAMLELLFPTKCAGCDLPGELLCGSCRETLPRIEPSTACPHCFAPYGWLVCTECWDADLGLDGAVAVGVLDRPLSRCVTIYKDAHERRLAQVLGELLAIEVRARWGGPVAGPSAPSPIADIVVPVPTSAKAIRERGYDHTLLLATCVSARLEIPCVALLEHVRSADQRSLSREERFVNMGEAFALSPAAHRAWAVTTSNSRPANHILDRVLLVDDVMTTGATLSAAANLLRQGGAREVRAGFVARAW